jgi:hypothetical protein
MIVSMSVIDQLAEFLSARLGSHSREMGEVRHILQDFRQSARKINAEKAAQARLVDLCTHLGLTSDPEFQRLWPRAGA